MSTPADIIKIAKISQYLSQNDIENKGLYGGGTDLLLPQKIYNIRKSVEWANSYNQPIELNLDSTSNYLNALCGKYGLEANYLISPGGSVSFVTSPLSTPNPIEFIISGSSLIANGGSSVIISSFIGFNLLFIRNGISQSSIDNGGSYFTWNKGTGTFTCYPAATTDELFQLYPFI